MGCQARRSTKRELSHSEFPSCCFQTCFDTAQTSAITVFVTPPSLLFTKLTFFLFYFQIFWPLRWLRVSVYIGATLTCIFYGAATIAQIAFEAPSPGETWLEVALSKRFTKTEILAVPFGAVGLVIDIVLLILPLVAVASLHLPPKRKIGVMFIFMFGILSDFFLMLSPPDC